MQYGQSFRAGLGNLSVKNAAGYWEMTMRDYRIEMSGFYHTVVIVVQALTEHDAKLEARGIHPYLSVTDVVEVMEEAENEQ